MIIGTFSVLMLTALASGFVLFVSYFIISKIFKSGKKAEDFIAKAEARNIYFR